MKTPVSLILLFVIASFTHSCSKDKQIDNETQLQQIKTTFTNIVWYRTYKINDLSKKMISMIDSANGFVSTSSFEYDINGKMSKVNFLQQGAITHSFEFEYNPAGTIHKRQVRSGTINVGDDYNTYSYDASGLLTIDSQFSKGNTATYQLFAVSKFHYTAGNVTEAEYYEVASGTLQLHSRMKYEYDSKLSPYKNLENHYFYNEFGSAIYDARCIGDNNVINEYSAKGDGPFQLTQTTTYQYNSSNYPFKLKPGINQSAANLVEEEYFYKQ
jgi:hypothetical protein